MITQENEEVLYNEFYEKTKDCGRTQFVKLLMKQEEEKKKLKKELKILSDNYKEMDKFHKSSFLNRSNYIKELEQENQQLKEQLKIIKKTTNELLTYLDKNKLVLNNQNILDFYINIKEILNKYIGE